MAKNNRNRQKNINNRNSTNYKEKKIDARSQIMKTKKHQTGQKRHRSFSRDRVSNSNDVKNRLGEKKQKESSVKVQKNQNNKRKNKDNKYVEAATYESNSVDFSSQNDDAFSYHGNSDGEKENKKPKIYKKSSRSSRGRENDNRYDQKRETQRKSGFGSFPIQKSKDEMATTSDIDDDKDEKMLAKKRQNKPLPGEKMSKENLNKEAKKVTINLVNLKESQSSEDPDDFLISATPSEDKKPDFKIRK